MKISTFFALLILFTGLQINSANAQPGIITTIAGSGVAGYSGDGGPATAAELEQAWAVCVDSTGNMYVVDYVNNVIRKVNVSGVMTTFAGTGTAGFSGDGGPATAAMLAVNPKGVAVDRYGSVYISDCFNNRIRKVDSNGIISTVAGNGIMGYGGDGGPATLASLTNPADMAVDRWGNIYIVDEFSQVIRKVDTFGIISTFAGNHSVGFSGDGGPAPAAALHQPIGVAVDNSGNVYIADQLNSCIRKVDSSGIISTIAGTPGYAGYMGDGSAATASQLYYPARIALDNLGNIFISDFYNNVVRKIDAAGIITTVAGTGFGAGTSHGAYSGDGGPATAAELSGPIGIAVDRHGDLIISDNFNNVIRKVGGDGGALVSSNVSISRGLLRVSPNPNNGSFKLSGQLDRKMDESITLSVYNVLGCIVYSQQFLSVKGVINAEVNLGQGIPNGVYTLQVGSQSGKDIFRFVIEK